MKTKEFVLCLAFLIFHKISTGQGMVRFSVLKKSPNFTAVMVGHPLRLDVKFNGTDKDIPMLVFIEWKFRRSLDSEVVRLLSITLDHGRVVSEKHHDTRALSSLDGESLLLHNTSLNDSGVYWCNVLSLPPRAYPDLYFNVTVEGKPKAEATCSNKVIAKQGTNFSCRCNAESVHFVPTAFWVKNGEILRKPSNLSQLLSLNNIGKKSAGTYVCRVQLYSMVDEKKVDIVVQYPPRITTFTGTVSREDNFITLTCHAEGDPQPTYSIYVSNDTVLPETSEGVVVVRSIVNESYTCVARNDLGHDKMRILSYFTIAQDKTPQKDYEDKGYVVKGMQWLIICISLLVGIILGFIILKCIQRSRARAGHTLATRPLPRARPASDIPVYVDPAALPISKGWKVRRPNARPLYVDAAPIPVPRKGNELRNHVTTCGGTSPSPPPPSSTEEASYICGNPAAGADVLPNYQELDGERPNDEHFYQSLQEHGETTKM